MAKTGRLGAGYEIRVDRLQLEPPVGARRLDQLLQFRGADDHDIRTSPVGRIGLDPGIAEADVGSLRHHVVAPVARGVLKEAGAPVTVRQVPPVLLARGTVVEFEMGAVPIGRPRLILDPVIERSDLVYLGPELPAEAFDHRSAFHMAAEQAERVRDPLTDNRVDAAQ